jgi:hypothetical protein
MAHRDLACGRFEHISETPALTVTKITDRAAKLADCWRTTCFPGDSDIALTASSSDQPGGRQMAATPSPYTRRARGCAVVVMLLSLGASFDTAHAAESYDNISTPAQRAACRPDVFRLCAGEIPSVSAITACLRRKKASLSDACRAVFEQ